MQLAKQCNLSWKVESCCSAAAEALRVVQVAWNNRRYQRCWCTGLGLGCVDMPKLVEAVPHQLRNRQIYFPC